ncbi:MAG: PKD domain-containing protein [Bacteroidota bacterium]
MKKSLILTFILTSILSNVFGQCSSLFSFGAYFETVNFQNQSSISNTHYFWNFGDGTGSNFKNPIHKFPDTGNYLVTLFAKDTITNCSSYYEYWLNLTKYSTDSCQPTITDSVFIYNSDYFIKVIDNSNNCSAYDKGIASGPAQNFQPGNWIWLGGGWQHARFLSRIQEFTNDTINGYLVHREAYKTSPFLYTSAKNYNSCSANYEFKVVSQNSTGQRILFKAMNNSATSYQWNTIALGMPAVSNKDTISQFFPFAQNNLWLVGLYTTGATGCKDTLYQSILVQNTTQTIESINELSQQIHYDLFPNPFTEQTTLSFESVKESTSFTLHNSTGQLIKSIDNITEGKVTINRDNLPSGFYFFILKTKDKQIATGKIIAE